MQPSDDRKIVVFFNWRVQEAYTMNARVSALDGHFPDILGAYGFGHNSFTPTFNVCSDAGERYLKKTGFDAMAAKRKALMPGDGNYRTAVPSSSVSVLGW